MKLITYDEWFLFLKNKKIDYLKQLKSDFSCLDNSKEFNGFINDVESGVGGTLGGASNKEPMEKYSDPKYMERKVGIEINKKKKKGAK